MGYVFRSALWNGSLLAPLDIGPALYAKFHWMDESQGQVPQNHYTVDIFDHELPRQYNIYQAIHAGEFPWWDPYTDCGRPLVAEGHISGTDGLRLIVYRFLPFVAAYNLTKLLHSLLLGLGTFLLLRQLGRPLGLSLVGAWSCQFAGSFVAFQTPLSVAASAVWYPWIWLAWSHYVSGRRRGWVILAGLFVALSIAAGNVQTLAFLTLFAGCFFLGNVWSDRTRGKAALNAALISCLLGALLALPVLIPQVQLYLLSERRPAFADFSRIQILTGAASLAGLFPWGLGTFRTLDLSKLFGQGSLGFCVFIGCAAFILSGVQVVGAFQKFRRRAETGVSVLLLLAYVVICSTPLVAVFYTRLATLVTLGLIVLASGAAGDLLEDKLSPVQRRVAMVMTAGLWLVFIGCNFFAFLIYPRIQDRVDTAFRERQQMNRSFGAAPDLRRYQVQNLPQEISVLNPATILGVSGATALAFAFWSSGQRRMNWLALALALNLLPELQFAERFTVKSPVVLWDRLVKGGPEQRRALDLLRGELRLREEATGRFDLVFPGALPGLYRVHAFRGYSSFGLPDLSVALRKSLPGAILQDVTFPGDEAGSFVAEPGVTRPGTPTARFQWQESSERKVHVAGETMNTVTIGIDPGEAGVLWRTDRYYPGWKLISPKLETRIVDRTFLAVNVPAGQQTLVFRYAPDLLPPALVISSLAALVCMSLLAIDWRTDRSRRTSNERGGVANGPARSLG